MVKCENYKADTLACRVCQDVSIKKNVKTLCEKCIQNVGCIKCINFQRCTRRTL